MEISVEIRSIPLERSKDCFDPYAEAVVISSPHNLFSNNNSFHVAKSGIYGQILVKIPDRGGIDPKKYKYGRENHLWAHTRHKNIIPFLGIYIQSATMTYCTVLEFMMGCSLFEIITGEVKYTPADVYSWLYQAARGLDYLHSGSIAHLDIKPGNLMVDPTKKILKICDFDSAIMMKIGEPIELPDHYTPYYLDSYAWNDPPSNIPRVKAMDIYSLGVTAWELFQKPTRCTPHDDGYAIRRISLDKPDKIIDREKITDSQTAHFIGRMWGTPPGRPTASEVREFMKRKRNGGKKEEEERHKCSGSNCK